MAVLVKVTVVWVIAAVSGSGGVRRLCESSTSAWWRALAMNSGRGATINAAAGTTLEGLRMQYSELRRLPP